MDLAGCEHVREVAREELVSVLLFSDSIHNLQKFEGVFYGPPAFNAGSHVDLSAVIPEV